MALACAAGGLALAWHHPLSGPIAVAAWLVLATASALWPRAWLVALPALLPAIALMPWTGWLTFEEFDLAVLAFAAGAHARLALRRAAVARAATGATGLKGFVLIGYGVALLFSVHQGFADAGGFVWGWWQGYHEPMNVVRVAKSLFLALLMLPLWRAALREAPERAAQSLADGLAAGLGVVALLALWERWAYPGLADFAADYRTTALFWEMHVGGAAFDGFLALTMPFAVLQLRRHASPLRWGLAAAIAMLGAYACLTTFSRGVYVAVPVGLAVTMVLASLQTRRGPERARAAGGWWAGILAWVAFALAAAWVFPSSGYRGLLALLGAVCLLLPMAAGWRRLPARGWAAGLALGIAASLVLGMLAWLPKGPYVAYTLIWFATAALVLWARWRPPATGALGTGATTVAAFVAVLVAMTQVAGHWGDAAGTAAMLPVALLLAALAVWSARGTRPRWPESWHWQGGLLATMAAAGVLVGVLFGGAYMKDRFATGSQDLEGRERHWSRALSLLRDPADWAFGKGPGRYPPNQFLSGAAEDLTGDYRLRDEAGRHHLALSAGRHIQGWGEMFRISQRVAAFTGPVTVSAAVRTETAVGLHFEACEKHLLYNGTCMGAEMDLPAQPGQWQPVQLPLPGPGLSHGDFFAPRFLVFSVAVNSSGRSVEFDHLRAVDANGRDLLVNGDFEQGMRRWFFSSDKYHLPWHMKNLPLHVLFEQGVVGLALLAALLVGALWRVTAGHARDHPLAPGLAGALAGFLAVGLFDSLLDVPRVAFLFYLLLGVALMLPARRGSSPAA